VEFQEGLLLAISADTEHTAGGASLHAHGREHRLYQVGWLKRVYKYTNEELKLAYDSEGFLPHEDDPKTSIALENLDSFSVNVNEATKEQLLRVPGVRPTSVQRIL
jgi:predicted DNA-binding helix-hairpin-helix protein